MSKTHTQPSNLQFTIELTDPETAEKYLAKAKPNRRIKPSDLDAYTRAMSQDQWNLTGEPIKFDQEGFLLDGQHRLRAIVASGKSVKLCVLRGLSPDAIYNMDTGRKRTGGDILSIHGVPNPVISSSIIKYYRDLLLVEAGKLSLPGFGRHRLAQRELVDAAQGPLGKTLEEAMSMVQNKTLLRSPSVFGALFLRFASIDLALTREFFTILNTGTTTNPVDAAPILALRTFLEDADTRRASKVSKRSRVLVEARVRPLVLVLVGTLAWNAWIRQKKLTAADLFNAQLSSWEGIDTEGPRLTKAAKRRGK